jgi:serine/threonine protein kinase
MVARQELIQKMKKMHLTIFGNLPFLFAYAAANARVQFFAIDRSLNFEEISMEFDLTKLKERIQCVVFSLQICRILFHYKPLLPTGFTPIYKEMPRNNGTITLYEDYIVKKLERPPYDFGAVKRIYDAIKKSLIECTIRCILRRNLTFHLAPVGYTIMPATDDELIAALVCVVRALVGLHAKGFVHRDIRWPNILCLGNRSFILIDFESAGRVGGSIPEELLQSRALDPLVVSDVEHRYYAWNDMYQVGKLIDVLSFRNPPLLELWNNLLNPIAKQRFTAEQTLKFLLDSCGQV